MSTLKEPNKGIELLKQRLSRYITHEGRQRALRFVPRSTDVIISTPPKCGTTRMQQIVHQLRSGGDMSFTDIDDVVPYIDLAYDVGQDLDAEHRYQPRCFKTHMSYESCPKGAKYIVIYREPCAVLYSSFNFFHGIYFQHREISLDEYVKTMLLFPNDKYPNYFAHLLSWWPKRNDPDVLFLLYEEMLKDLESSVKAVASFMGIDDKACIANAVRMSSFDFMRQNREKYACHYVSRHRFKAMGLPQDKLLQRVGTASATKGRESMEDRTEKAVKKMWTDKITNVIGFAGYEGFSRAVREKIALQK